MASKSPNLKVNVTADTSDLNRKLKDSKTSVKDFESATSGALSAIGQAFGVNTQQVEKMSSAIKGLGVKMQESGNAGAASFGKLLSGVTGVTTALSGVGLAAGGAVAGFKLLNSEAEAFKNTVEGASIELQTSAYVSTYTQVLHDLRGAGKEVAEQVASAERELGTFGEKSKSFLLQWQAGIMAAQGVVMPEGQTLFSEVENRRAANNAAQDAASIAEEIYDTQLQIVNSSVRWAELERDIAELRTKAKQDIYTIAERTQFLGEAEQKILDRYKEEAELKAQLATLQEEYNQLAKSPLSDIQKANQYRIDSMNAIQKQQNGLREIIEGQKTLSNEAKKEADARAASVKAVDDLVEKLRAREELRIDTSNMEITSSVQLPKAEQMSAPGIAIPITPVLDTQAVVDISAELESLMVSSFENIGATMGQLIGDIATGGDAFANFSHMAIASMGDMAIAVGQMAIKTGVATLGIKAALESLNGWVAIAAGTALVALGTAVKSGLSNIAQGNYSAGASSNIASSGYGSSMSNGFDTREMVVKVTGTLTGSGSTLKAVIDNENTRQNRTT